MQQTSAEDYCRTLRLWVHWVRRLNRAHDARTLATMQAYELLARERFAIRCADFALERSVQRMRRDRFAAGFADYDLNRIVRRQRVGEFAVGRAEERGPAPERETRLPRSGSI
jgi:hypothetical protein